MPETATSRSPDRRMQILDAALDLFVAKGFAATSIDDIRKLSGASTGSIYHFFASKEAIAVALYIEGVTGWTAASLAVPDDAVGEAAIGSIIASTLGWGLANARLMRFMDETRFLITRVAGLAETTEVLLRARQRGEALLARLVAHGEVRPVPWEIANALLLGPVQAWLQLHRYGQASLCLQGAQQELTAAAWQALRQV